MEDNLHIQKSQLIIFNTRKNEIISVINLKNEIVDLIISKEAIYTLLKKDTEYVLLVFDTTTLKLIYQIRDIHFNFIAYSNMSFIDCVLIAIPRTLGKVELFKFSIKKNSIYKLSRKMLNTEFSSLA